MTFGTGRWQSGRPIQIVSIRGVMIPIFFGIGIGITFTSRKLVGIGIGIDGVIFTTGFGSNAGIGFTAGIGSTTKIGLINVPASK